MLDYSSSEVMSRKEYLNRKKRNSNRFWFLKYILLFVVAAGLVIYLVYQLNVYKKVTEAAYKVMEESKLIKTYKILFMGESYIKDGEDIMYLYSGMDESRKPIESGAGMKAISINDGYIYGVKDANLYKINMVDFTQELICERGVCGYIAQGENVYVYKNIDSAPGLFKKIDGEYQKIVNGGIYQLVTNGENIFTVEASAYGKSIVRRDMDGQNPIIISGTDNVVNIALYKDSIYYTNMSDAGKIYKITFSGQERTCITNNAGVSTFSDMHYQSYLGAYDNKVIYISKDNNQLYISLGLNEEDELLIEEKVSKIQVVENMVYVKLKDSLNIVRVNLDTKEVMKITSARTETMFCFK